MDLTPNSTHTLDTDTPNPPPTQPTNPCKSSSFANGTLKRHHSTTVAATPPPPTTMVVSYKECLKNHAATIGGHALDGCGEFMPSSSSNPTEPRSLTCAACGCHRNFHRRDTQHQQPQHCSNPNFLSFYHSPPPPPPSVAAPPLPHRGLSLSTSSPSMSPSPSPSQSPMSSPSPPPLSHHFPPSSFHHQHNSSAPHMLLALGNACSDNQVVRSFNFSVAKAEINNKHNPNGGKKRHRTKFSQEQKEKMQSFSEKLGWRMQKGDEELIHEFCNEIGVSREVFKVWMHNNKNNFRKRSSEITGNAPSADDEEKINGDHNGNVNNPFSTNGNNNDNIH